MGLLEANGFGCLPVQHACTIECASLGAKERVCLPASKYVEGPIVGVWSDGVLRVVRKSVTAEWKVVGVVAPCSVRAGGDRNAGVVVCK